MVDFKVGKIQTKAANNFTNGTLSSLALPKGDPNEKLFLVPESITTIDINKKFPNDPAVNLGEKLAIRDKNHNRLIEIDENPNIKEPKGVDKIIKAIAEKRLKTQDEQIRFLVLGCITYATKTRELKIEEDNAKFAYTSLIGKALAGRDKNHDGYIDKQENSYDGNCYEKYFPKGENRVSVSKIASEMIAEDKKESPSKIDDKLERVNLILSQYKKETEELKEEESSK